VLELTVRLVVSLAFVLGLLLLLARFGSRRFRSNRDAMVRVLHRQPLSRSSAVAVVAVGQRVLVLGTTEQQVRVLAELDPEEAAELVSEADVVTLVPPGGPDTSAPVTLPGAHRAAVPVVRTSTPGTRRAEGPLTGSVLSADTWRQALAAAATRRSS
jgi:flagellar protein FliO/FliZ